MVKAVERGMEVRKYHACWRKKVEKLAISFVLEATRVASQQAVRGFFLGRVGFCRISSAETRRSVPG